MTFVKSTKLHVLFAAYVNVKHNACVYYYCQHCYVVGQWRQYCDEFEMACVGGGSVSGWIVTEVEEPLPLPILIPSTKYCITAALICISRLHSPSGYYYTVIIIA